MNAAADALESMVSTVHQIAHPAGVAASFAVLVTDGKNLIALRTAVRNSAPTLYTTLAGDEAPVPSTGRIVSSEPLFAGRWTSLDSDSLVTFCRESD